MQLQLLIIAQPYKISKLEVQNFELTEGVRINLCYVSICRVQNNVRQSAIFRTKIVTNRSKTLMPVV